VPTADPSALRVLLVDESAPRAALMREGLENAGYEVLATLSSPFALDKAIVALAPDVIIVDIDSPTRDTLEHVVMSSRDDPRPIIMFTNEGGPAQIRDAMRAGVAAYVVDGVNPQRVGSIIEIAVARFDEFQRLREELANANRKLEERKVVERAKGLLMRTRGLSEEDAYAFLRKVAMSRKEKLAQVAQRVIEAG
jgi:response regulator NasT